MENYFLKEIEPILNRLDDSIENIKTKFQKEKKTLKYWFCKKTRDEYIPTNFFFSK